MAFLKNRSCPESSILTGQLLFSVEWPVGQTTLGSELKPNACETRYFAEIGIRKSLRKLSHLISAKWGILNV